MTFELSKALAVKPATNTDALIKGLIGVFGAEEQAKKGLSDAKEGADQMKAGSLKAFSTLVRGMNDLDDDTISEVAAKVAAAITSDPKTEKVRKSEIKLLLEYRGDIPGLMEGFDKLADDIRDVNADRKDQKKKPLPVINTRSEVLKGLRTIRRAAEAVKKTNAGRAPGPDDVVTARRMEVFAETADDDASAGVMEALDVISEFDAFNRPDPVSGVRSLRADVAAAVNVIKAAALGVAVANAGAAVTAVAVTAVAVKATGGAAQEPAVDLDVDALAEEMEAAAADAWQQVATVIPALPDIVMDDAELDEAVGGLL